MIGYDVLMNRVFNVKVNMETGELESEPAAETVSEPSA